MILFDFILRLVRCPQRKQATTGTQAASTNVDECEELPEQVDLTSLEASKSVPGNESMSTDDSDDALSSHHDGLHPDREGFCLVERKRGRPAAAAAAAAAAVAAQVKKQATQRARPCFFTFQVVKDRLPELPCSGHPIERLREIAVLHKVCERLAAVTPQNRPKSLKSFESFTRQARSIRTYTLDWQAIAASLDGAPTMPQQPLPEDMKEAATPAQLEAIQKRFAALRPLNQQDLIAWIQGQSCVSKTCSAEAVLAELRSFGLLAGDEDFGLSMNLTEAKRSLPKTEWLPTTLPAAGSKLKDARAVFQMKLPCGTEEENNSVGAFLGHAGEGIKAHLNGMKEKMAAAKVHVSKVSCRIQGLSEQNNRRKIRGAAVLKLEITLQEQSIPGLKRVVEPILAEWYEGLERRYSQHFRDRAFRQKMDRVEKEESRTPTISSAKALATAKWEQQLIGRLRDRQHRQEQEDKIQRCIRHARRGGQRPRTGRRNARTTGIVQVIGRHGPTTRFERRQHLIEVDSEPAAWDFL